MSNTKDEVNISKLYAEDCFASKEEFLKRRNVNEKDGLTNYILEENFKKFGPNILKKAKSHKDTSSL